MSTKRLLLLVYGLFFTCYVSVAQSNSGFWKPIYKGSSEKTVLADSWATHYQMLTLKYDGLKQELLKAPLQENVNAGKSSFIFALPMPDGSFKNFRLVESPVMDKALNAAYPYIRTYCGVGVDDQTAYMRCDITQFGFHAMMRSAAGTVFVDPLDLRTKVDYVSYYRQDALPHGERMQCLLDEKEHLEIPSDYSPTDVQTIFGKMRTYRLALACTGEYAAYYGGTVAGAFAGMVTSVNRVNEVYETEFGIHMNLIPNDTILVYTNANTDPYTNMNGSTMLTQNQNTVTSLIGADNYDIGHVFSTGGGGIAGLGVICTNNTKAKGVTGMDTPIGDAFDIDYVAHEMGHEFGANHTFNSTAGSCGGGNRSANSAYEPGSGSTIMAYAGICSPQDLQLHSDPYFHVRSFDEIIYYTNNGAGNGCAVLTTTTNTAPVLTVPGNYTIPLNTPFRLTASATDAENDTLTYCWEEWDLGAAGNWNAPVGNAPIFRSFNPTTSGTRLFPKLASILTNSTTIGEIKPSYARVLNFRCTVRDNDADGPGITYNATTVKVTVASTGPFAILTPNTTGITWAGGTTKTVTWSVNHSDSIPVNCANVNVLLSTNGGQTFPIVLGSNVPNNGSYSFTVPALSTVQARVMVEGAGNIFFDINDKNFTITPTVGIETSEFAQSVNLIPNPTTGNFSLVMDNEELGMMNVKVMDIAGQVVYQKEIDKSGSELKLDIDLNSLSTGMYFVEVQSAKSKMVKKLLKN